MRFHARSGGDGDWPHRSSPLREKDELGPPIARIGPPLDVAGTLEVCDRLCRRLLAHVRELCQLADADPLGWHEGKHVGVWRANIVEAGRAQSRVDFLRIVLIQQSQQEPDQGLGDIPFVARDRQPPVYILR